MVFRLITTLLLLATLCGCSGVYFYPMEAWVQNPANQGLEYEDVVLIHPDGTRLHGWWLPAKGYVRGTVYFLHGNAENISTHLANVQWLPAEGYNVFLLDYRGYGLSEGKPRLPEALEDVMLGLNWLRGSQRTDGKPLAVFGQSLGAALGTTILGKADNGHGVDCVMLEAPFASYRGVADDVMSRSWLLWPFKWLVLPTLPPREMDPAQRVAGLSPTPLLVMHSRDDRIVPFSQGEQLYQAAREPKVFQSLNGGHSQSTRDPAVRQRLLQFMAANGCAAQPPQVVPEPPERLLPGAEGYRF